MSSERLSTRLELARGHWGLGEHDLALLCLERAVIESPDAPELRRVIGAWAPQAPPAVRGPLLELELRLVPVEGGGPTPNLHNVGELNVHEPGPGEMQPETAAPDPRVSELVPDSGAVDLPPLATSTVAELLADQGNLEQAIHVAEDVLRRNPSDARAQAVRELAGQNQHPQARVIAALERWLRRIEERPSQARAQEVSE